MITTVQNVQLHGMVVKLRSRVQRLFKENEGIPLANFFDLVVNQICNIFDNFCMYFYIKEVTSLVFHIA